MAYVYILRLKSGGLYIGSTVNLHQRVQDHLLGHGCRTTRLDPPVELVYSELYDSIEPAEEREIQLKHWSRSKKEALILGDLHSLKSLSKCRNH